MEHPLLEFNNTVSWDTDGLQQERLPEWLKRARVEPSRLREAFKLRALIHRVFTAIADGRKPRPDDWRDLQREIARAMRDARLVRSGDRYVWQVTPKLRELAWQAGQLLASPDLARLRRCANSECGWLFLDESRRGNRRWCEMAACGSRAKARAYYERKKK